MKKTIVILSVLFAACLVLLAAALYTPAAETFSCDRCHRQVTEKPIFIAEQTVDVTVCSDCYQDYLKGMWKICRN